MSSSKKVAHKVIYHIFDHLKQSKSNEKRLIFCPLAHLGTEFPFHTNNRNNRLLC